MGSRSAPVRAGADRTGEKQLAPAIRRRVRAPRFATARELEIVATNSAQSEAGASVTEHSTAELRPLAMPGLAVIRMARMIGSDRGVRPRDQAALGAYVGPRRLAPPPAQTAALPWHT